jgi:uncharacterized protein YndB with AHSA1/START domain
MDKLSRSQVPIAKEGMLIRKPAELVYEAFVDPAITTRFWFTRSSGRLEAGRRIRWDWEIYGVFTLLDVKALEPGKHILLERNVDRMPTSVEWIFQEQPGKGTYVTIMNSGFSGNGDRVVEQAMDSASGFALVLAGLKAYLEFGIELNLIADRHPDLLVKQTSKKNQ